MLKDIILRLFHHNLYKINLTTAKMVSVGNVTLEYCIIGEGQPFLLVMGYASLLNGWNIKLLYELSKQYKVVVFNNRHTGASFSEDPLFTLTDLTDDIDRLIVGLQLENIILCGLSMGGMLAQNFASTYPNRIKKLILLNTLPPGDLHFPPPLQVIETLKNIHKISITNAYKIIKLILPSTWQIFLLGLYRFTPRKNTISMPTATVIQQQAVLREWAELPRPAALLQNIAAPTLILTGGLDRIVPIENWEKTAWLFKQYQKITYPGGGHLMIYQFPVIIANAIKTFINE